VNTIAAFRAASPEDKKAFTDLLKKVTMTKLGAFRFHAER